MLSSGSKTGMTQSTMTTNLLQTLKILSDLVVQDVSHYVVGLAVLVVSLPVEGPVRDLVLTGILKRTSQISYIMWKKIITNLHAGNDLLDIFLNKISSSLGHGGDVSLL